MAQYLEQHAEEGQVLRTTTLAPATPQAVDCTAWMLEGCKVVVAHNGTGVCAYKFSANPVATGNIDTTSTSGALAGAWLTPNSYSLPALIPNGKPYLHVVATAAANVSVHRSSATR